MDSEAGDLLAGNSGRRFQLRHLAYFNLVVGLCVGAAFASLGVLCWFVFHSGCGACRVAEAFEWPSILGVFPLGLAGLGLGALIGFTYAAFGNEQKQFSPFFAAFNGLIGGALMTDILKGKDSISGKVATNIAQAIGAGDYPALVLVIALPFACAGFILVHLNKTLLFGRELAGISRDTRDDERSVEELGVGGKHAKTIKSGKDGAVVSPDDDPQKGKWGGKPYSDGVTLSAEVTPSDSKRKWFRVVLKVQSADATKPLTDSVVFHLHPSFRKPVTEVAVENGVAQLVLFAWGAFTVGAEANHGTTKLELDLSTLHNAPMEFRNR